MNRFIFMITLLCYGSFSRAQQVDNYRQDTTTLYHRAKGFSTDPIRSKWRQEVKKENDLFVLYLYDKKDVLQELISFADKTLLERKGPYVFYQNGNVKEEGLHDKGYKVGQWKRYHANKQLFETVNYSWDSISGPRKMYYKDGKLALDEFYSPAGNLETSKYFNEQGQEVDLAYVKNALPQKPTNL